MEVPDETLVERGCGRRLDPETGDIYHMKFKPAAPPRQLLLLLVAVVAVVAVAAVTS